MTKTIFERVLSGEYEGSFVYRDATCAAFMDLNPLNPGHVLVVPIEPVERLSLLDSKVGVHLFEIAQRILRAIETSGLKIEGANIFLSDGEVAGQEVPHVHLHVVPRFNGDGIKVSFGKPFRREDRQELNRVAAMIARAMP